MRSKESMVEEFTATARVVLHRVALNKFQQITSQGWLLPRPCSPQIIFFRSAHPVHIIEAIAGRPLHRAGRNYIFLNRWASATRKRGSGEIYGIH